MARTDAELLVAARNGDPTAIDELLSKHERQVYRFGLRMCGSEEDAKEVLQNTLLAAFKGLHDFRGEAALSTWLYQIARSYCIKRRRRTEGEPAELEAIETAPAQAVMSAEATPEAETHAREIGEALQAAIQALPEHYREVVVLRDVEGLSTEEAAHIVGVEERALKSRLHRARQELRENLTTLLEQPEGSGPGCPELARELANYTAEDIDRATCISIENHLRSCPTCSKACDGLKRSVSMCRAIPGDEVPGPVKAAVRQALKQAAAKP
jgi:RNA polymerase sigma-70 factor (ECF subfamily)